MPYFVHEYTPPLHRVTPTAGSRGRRCWSASLATSRLRSLKGKAQEVPNHPSPSRRRNGRNRRTEAGLIRGGKNRPVTLAVVVVGVKVGKTDSGRERKSGDPPPRA